VGIEEWDAQIKIYPNPTTGELRVECRDAINRVCTGVEIYDVYGRKVFEQKAHLTVLLLNQVQDYGLTQK
jgi:hypothetical protein